ncbi:MAG TPA: helix-turn-helix domain-containing protein [Reyranella sp.]|jgi:AcrR family transcriptional regulator|nr:helix-turn-helix domain-containing protein [Reyranella sp.]
MSRPRAQAARTQAERLAATRAALLKAARTIFAEQGYAAAATEEIVRRAKVTRGALYHHFEDKRSLFDAVAGDVAREIAEKIDAMTPMDDPLKALIVGTGAFLDACLDPAVRRIYLIDAPAVLGWHRWREIDAPHGVRSLREGVSAMLAERPDEALAVEPTTFLLAGAFNEAALWIAEAKDEKAARRAMDRSLAALIERLFVQSRSPRARARA